MMRMRFPLPLGLLVALSFLATACGGTRPYVDPLAELHNLRESAFTETMRVDPEAIEDPNVRELREQSVEMLEACDLYSELAYENWDKKDDDLADEYARVGLIYYRSAENFARSAEARLRLNDANEAYQEQRRRRNEYNDQLRAETELISLLTTITELFERNEALRRELATIEEQYQSESRAMYAIQESRILEREASGMKADDFAPTVYAEANAILARAQQHYDDEQYEEAYDVALRAMETYRMAIQQSQGDYLAEQDAIMRDGENQQIFEAAQRVFGPELAFIDARGIVIVLPHLFERNESEVRDSERARLDQVLDLLRAHSGREVLVEGHTQDRGATDANMALSQTRASEVQNYFLERAVRGSRLSTAGFGEEAPRFDNRTSDGRSDNDRVEVVFLFD